MKMINELDQEQGQDQERSEDSDESAPSDADSGEAPSSSKANGVQTKASAKRNAPKARPHSSSSGEELQKVRSPPNETKRVRAGAAI